MSAETQKVDVLALMDLQVLVGETSLQEAREENVPDLLALELAIGVNVRNLRSARDAMAELIEAATSFENYASDVGSTTRKINARKRLNAALARVGGAA